ncbi:Pulmonary surfactant-associated protein D [Varanus komodoensis]|nr:Pulmonary surfactant-associated protein D [Varanus komodoensis]
MMLVLLTFGALVSQVSPAASPPRDQVIRSLDQNACSLVVCGPAQNGLPGRDGRDGIQGPKGEDRVESKVCKVLLEAQALLEQKEAVAHKVPEEVLEHKGPKDKRVPLAPKALKGLWGKREQKEMWDPEVNLMKKQVSTLEGQLKALQASFSKYQKVAMFPGGRIVGNKVFITTGYEGNFDDLKQRCLQAGGQLASPRNAAENTAVQQIAALYNKIVFLGITDLQSEGKFKYLNGDAISYSNWLPGEPNNDKNREHCVEVFANGKWNDKVCSERRLIVCEF